MESLSYLFIGILSSAILTGGAFWLQVGRDKISRLDMENYVAQSSPWARERGEIMAILRANAETATRLEHAIEGLVASHQEILIRQESLTTKISLLMEK